MQENSLYYHECTCALVFIVLCSMDVMFSPQEQSTLNSVMAETAVLNCFKVTEWKHTGCKCRSKFHLGNIMSWWQGVRGRGNRQHPSTFGDF